MADGILPQSTTPTADPSILPGQQLTPAVPAGQQSGVVAQAAAPAPQVPPATEFSDDMMHSLKNLAMVGALTGNEKLVGSLHYAVEMMKTDSFTGRMEAGGKVLEQMQRAGAGREAIEAFGKKYSFYLLGSNINVFAQTAAEPAKAKIHGYNTEGQVIVEGTDGGVVAKDIPGFRKAAKVRATKDVDYVENGVKYKKIVYADNLEDVPNTTPIELGKENKSKKDKVDITRNGRVYSVELDENRKPIWGTAVELHKDKSGGRYSSGDMTNDKFENAVIQFDNAKKTYEKNHESDTINPYQSAESQITNKSSGFENTPRAKAMKSKISKYALRRTGGNRAKAKKLIQDAFGKE